MPKSVPRRTDGSTVMLHLPARGTLPLRASLERIASVAASLLRMPMPRLHLLAGQLYDAIRVIQEETAIVGVHFKTGAPYGQEGRWERERDERWERLKVAFQREAQRTVQLMIRKPRGETPGQKSARLRRAERILRDQGDAFTFAAQIDAGATTEEARENLGIGARRAERLRAVAVSVGLLRPRQRGTRPRDTRRRATRAPGAKGRATGSKD